MLPVPGEVVSTKLSTLAEERRKIPPEDDHVEIYAPPDHEKMKNVKPIIK